MWWLFWLLLDHRGVLLSRPIGSIGGVLGGRYWNANFAASVVRMCEIIAFFDIFTLDRGTFFFWAGIFLQIASTFRPATYSQ